jgi:hypothetical protein
MFPLDFPLGQLELYPDARHVLDPFCGRGTTGAKPSSSTAAGKLSGAPVAKSMSWPSFCRLRRRG